MSKGGLGSVDPFKNIGKIPKLSQLPTNKSTSPRIPKPKNADEDFCTLGKIFDSPNLDIIHEIGRDLGEQVFYSGGESKDYLSQSDRYERSMELFPVKVIDDSTGIYYYFSSCSSPSGLWIVEIRSDDVSFEVVKPIWNILCPRPIVFDAIESNATSFTWRQVSGNRTASLDGINLSSTFRPGFRLTPALDILTLCIGSGCGDGSPLPIRLEVYPDGRPELLDTIFIQTTPISFYDGFCYSQFDSPLEKAIVKSSIAYTQKAYLNAEPSILGIDWIKPDQNSEHIVGYAIQENINGVFTTIQSYGVNDNLKYLGKFSTSYRVISYFSNNGHQYATTSNAFRFDAFSQVTSAIGNTSEDKVLFGDDDYGSSLSYEFYYNSHESLPLNVQFINPANDDYGSSLSYEFYYNSHESLPLNVQFINPANDDYGSSLSYEFYYNSHETIDIGGVAIG